VNAGLCVTLKCVVMAWQQENIPQQWVGEEGMWVKWDLMTLLLMLQPSAQRERESYEANKALKHAERYR